jgi:CubicO group peptidase (beta-lactamase class C family)
MRRICLIALFATVILASPVSPPSLVIAKPEEVGFSSERLQRIHETIQRRIDANEISGAVTLVVRRGRVAHFEAHGLMDLETKRPMAKDVIFRIASMSKPITATAVLLLMEEGKLRLTDPVSKFLPAFKDMDVAVARQQTTGQSSSNPSAFYTIPAERQITIRDLLTHVSGLVARLVGVKLPRFPTP